MQDLYPMLILFAGVMVGENLRGEALAEKLKELFQ